MAYENNLKEIILPSQMKLGEGWHELEFDGEKQFRWSSLSSLLTLYQNITSRGKLLVIYAGNPDYGSGRLISIRGTKGKLTNQFVSGWKYYSFNIDAVISDINDHIAIEFDAPIKTKDDTRKLGGMIHSISIIETSNLPKEYLDNNIFSRCINFNSVRLFSHGNNDSGIILLNLETINTKKNFIYIDISYEAQGVNNSFIEFECGDYKENILILLGGLRMFSLKISSKDLIKNTMLKFSTNVTSIDFKDITIRHNYYDFLGLKSKNIDLRKMTLQEKKTLDLSKNVDFAIQWFVTWKCNFKCPYCWQDSYPKIYRKPQDKDINISAEIWAKRLNELKPKTIYFSGGEPFLYKNLLKVIELLDKKIHLIMISNLSDALDLDSFVKTIKPARFKELAFSFHPTQYDINIFFNKLSYLISKKFDNLKVNMVLSVENIPYAELVLRKCKEHNILAIFGRCELENKNHEYFSEGCQKKVEHFLKKAHDQNKTLQFKNFFKIFLSKCKNPSYFLQKTKYRSPAFFKNDPIFCTAGLNRIVLDYKGEIFVCTSAIDRGKKFGECALPHYQSIGNIFAKDFELLKKPIICWESFRCSACDSEYLNKAWNSIGNVYNNIDSFPLPE